MFFFFFFQAEDGIRDYKVTGVQTCALPISTLRDGEQAPGNSMTAEEKLRLARQLDTLGVDVIEAGFPSASEGDRRGVRAIAEAVRRPVIAALARCHDRDIDLAGEAVRPAARPRVHVFIATSDLHLQCKLRLSRDQCLEIGRASCRERV